MENPKSLTDTELIERLEGLAGMDEESAMKLSPSAKWLRDLWLQARSTAGRNNA